MNPFSGEIEKIMDGAKNLDIKMFEKNYDPKNF
jgi:hypothetical protein